MTRRCAGLGAGAILCAAIFGCGLSAPKAQIHNEQVLAEPQSSATMGSPAPSAARAPDIFGGGTNTDRFRSSDNAGPQAATAPSPDIFGGGSDVDATPASPVTMPHAAVAVPPTIFGGGTNVGGRFAPPEIRAVRPPQPGVDRIFGPSTDVGAAPAAPRIESVVASAAVNSASETMPVASPPAMLALQRKLKDCHIPFDELKEKAESCLLNRPQSPQRCESYASSQFPEILLIRVRDAEHVSNLSTPHICTGTLIAPDWVLTAAHCFVGDRKTSDVVGAPDFDHVFMPRYPWGVVVSAKNARSLPTSEQSRSILRAIVYRGYNGRGEAEGAYYLNDLAVAQLAAPFPIDHVPPAVLAPPHTFTRLATIAGYGYSDAAGGTLGQFDLTWPAPLRVERGELSFTPVNNPGDGIQSGFCEGDSGGPVLAGRYRGCWRSDPAGEPRPRYVQGVISYYLPPKPQPPVHAQPAPISPETTPPNANLVHVNKCKGAASMVMQSITVKERHAWICAATDNEARGCR